MTIVPAIYKNSLVDVLDVWKSSGRMVALVRALEGQQFEAWSHGGWCYDDHTTVPVGLLEPVPTCHCESSLEPCEACRLSAIKWASMAEVF